MPIELSGAMQEQVIQSSVSNYNDLVGRGTFNFISGQFHVAIGKVLSQLLAKMFVGS